MAWIHLDPEEGPYRDEFGGTHKYEDGKTLAERYPEGYTQIPTWRAWVMQFTKWLHRKAYEWALGAKGGK